MQRIVNEMDVWNRVKIRSCVKAGNCTGEIDGLDGVTFEDLLPYLLDERDISAGDCEDPQLAACAIHDVDDVDPDTGKIGIDYIIIDVVAIEGHDAIKKSERAGKIVDSLNHERLHYKWKVKYVEDPSLPVAQQEIKEDHEEHQKVYDATPKILDAVFNPDGTIDNVFEEIGAQYPFTLDEYIYVEPNWIVYPIVK